MNFYANTRREHSTLIIGHVKKRKERLIKF
nr:MAG TPA: hypothetical protein [Caudoviricetes sp.]